jgi:hypothetical protein
MTCRLLLELVTRWAGLRRCGAEVSLENLVGIDSASIQLHNARDLYLHQIQIAVSNPMTNSFFIHLSTLYPLPEQGASFNTHRPTLVQRFSPIRF